MGMFLGELGLQPAYGGFQFCLFHPVADDKNVEFRIPLPPKYSPTNKKNSRKILRKNRGFTIFGSSSYRSFGQLPTSVFIIHLALTTVNFFYLLLTIVN